MGQNVALIERLQREIRELPTESLSDLEKFVEFLRFKAKPEEKRDLERLDTTQARRLRGILKGYDFSPEFIAQARREMWRKYHTEDAQ